MIFSQTQYVRLTNDRIESSVEIVVPYYRAITNFAYSLWIIIHAFRLSIISAAIIHHSCTTLSPELQRGAITSPFLQLHLINLLPIQRDLNHGRSINALTQKVISGCWEQTVNYHRASEHSTRACHSDYLGGNL